MIISLMIKVKENLKSNWQQINLTKVLLVREIKLIV